jgi:hypothetical protein
MLTDRESCGIVFVRFCSLPEYLLPFIIWYELVGIYKGGISYNETQNGAYALILTKVDERKLPIVIELLRRNQ